MPPGGDEDLEHPQIFFNLGDILDEYFVLFTTDTTDWRPLSSSKR